MVGSELCSWKIFLTQVGKRDTRKESQQGDHLQGHCGCPKEGPRSLNGKEVTGMGRRDQTRKF